MWLKEWEWRSILGSFSLCHWYSLHKSLYSAPGSYDYGLVAVILQLLWDIGDPLLSCLFIHNTCFKWFEIRPLVYYIKKLACGKYHSSGSQRSAAFYCKDFVHYLLNNIKQRNAYMILWWNGELLLHDFEHGKSQFSITLCCRFYSYVPVFYGTGLSFWISAAWKMLPGCGEMCSSCGLVTDITDFIRFFFSFWKIFSMKNISKIVEKTNLSISKIAALDCHFCTGFFCLFLI